MIRLLLQAVVACGSSHEPAPPPAPVPAPTAPVDAAAPPALSSALAARWQKGCFLLKTPTGLVETDHARCSEPRRPYSTFKIANALIGLDAGLLDGPDAPMTWDKKAVPDEKRYRDEWRKPQTLRTAFALSSVPHFRTLARTLGETRMKAGLAKLGYGNQSIEGGIDQFWLARGGMRISAEQQLALVDALAHGKLTVSQKAQDTLREISVLETSGARVMHGKTGSGPTEDQSGDWLVWRVGWIEDGKAILPYAAWIVVHGGTFDEARAARDELLTATFAELRVFP